MVRQIGRCIDQPLLYVFGNVRQHHRQQQQQRVAPAGVWNRHDFDFGTIGTGARYGRARPTIGGAVTVPGNGVAAAPGGGRIIAGIFQRRVPAILIRLRDVRHH